MKYLAEKIGMSSLYDNVGLVIPVTVMKLQDPLVVDIQSNRGDYVVIGYGGISVSRLNKPAKGIFDKNSLVYKKILKSYQVDSVESYKIGENIDLSFFKDLSFVDVRGTSKGKGYCGVIKKHGFSRGPESHGSRHHREPGSIGDVDPSRVFKGRKLPGRKGADTVCIQNLKIVSFDSVENILVIKGAVPGANKSFLWVSPAIKKK